MTTTNKTLPVWRNAITDSIKYDPLTGTYKYLVSEPIDTTSNQVNYLANEFWTPMGQPKRIDQSKNRNEDKKY